jgi:hypothetical protein
MHHIDQAQLVAGMLRSFMWAVGAAVAFGQRRVLLVIGLGLATVTSVVFALSNAGAPVSMTLFHVTSYASTVTPSLVVASLIMTTRSPRLGRTWRL